MSEKEDSQGFVKAIVVGALSTLLGTGLLWMFGLGEQQAPIVVQATPGATDVTPVSAKAPRRRPLRKPDSGDEYYADDDPYYSGDYDEEEIPAWEGEPEQPAWNTANVTGTWQGSDGLIYTIQSYGGELAVAGTNPQWQTVTLTGTGTIDGSMVDLYYTRLDGLSGHAQLEVSRNGQQMAGSYNTGGYVGQILLRR